MIDPEAREKALEMLRRSVPLRLDRQGHWFHSGEPFRHPGIIRVFDQGIDVDPASGEGILRVGDRWCYVDCDQTPLIARTLILDEFGGHFGLNNGQSVSVDAVDFFAHEGELAIRMDVIRWAWLSRHCMSVLSNYLVEVDGEYRIQLPHGEFEVSG